MKITIDIPDTTLCVTAAIVFISENGGMRMDQKMIDTKDLETKGEIKIVEVEPNGST